MPQSGVNASGAGVASELMSIQDQTEGCILHVPRREGITSWFVLEMKNRYHKNDSQLFKKLFHWYLTRNIRVGLFQNSVSRQANKKRFKTFH